jgi:hypothetical protein
LTGPLVEAAYGVHVDVPSDVAPDVPGEPGVMLQVSAGQILLYRLFDVAESVDLAIVERELRNARQAGEGVARLRLQRQRDGVVFTNPPVSAILADRTLELDGREWNVRVVAKVYDFGAMTIVWALSIPSGTSFEQLAELSVELESDQMRADLARWMSGDAELAVEAMRAGLESPAIHESQETLTIYAIRGFVGDELTPADVVAQHPSLPSLLLGERDSFSSQLRGELLRSSYSYSTNDLVVIGYDQALVYDPDGTDDASNLLEFAVAQVLELAYYDRQLDERIRRMHRQLSGRRSLGLSADPSDRSASRLSTRSGWSRRLRIDRTYDALRRDLLTEHLAFSDVIERVNSAVKVTEDLYYAAIYRGAMRVFRANELAAATEHKLEVMHRTYSMLSDEAEANTSHRLEWIVIILILIEVVYGTVEVVNRILD